MSKARANGEGTICLRADGRWCGAVSLPDGRRKFVYGPTRQSVATKVAALLESVHKGRFVSTDRATVAQYLTEWLQSYKSSVRRSTWSRYRSLIEVHAIPGIGSQRLSTLEPRHLNVLYASLLRTTENPDGLSAASVRQLHAVIRRALQTGVQEGVLGINPATAARPPRVEKPQIRPLDELQAARMLRAASGTRLEALWVLALTTGMRLGEILALRWDAVASGASPYVQVKHTLYRSGGSWSLEPPKSREARRRIDLTGRAVIALEAHRRRQSEERLALGPAWAPHDLVFTDEVGEPLSGTAVYRRQFAQLLEAAELPPTTRFHDLRHTFATLLLLRGVHVKIVSSMLGHSTIRLTLDTYSHVLPGMQRSATDALDAILG